MDGLENSLVLSELPRSWNQDRMENLLNQYNLQFQSVEIYIYSSNVIALVIFPNAQTLSAAMVIFSSNSFQVDDKKPKVKFIDEDMRFIRACNEGTAVLVSNIPNDIMNKTIMDIFHDTRDIVNSKIPNVKGKETRGCRVYFRDQAAAVRSLVQHHTCVVRGRLLSVTKAFSRYVRVRARPLYTHAFSQSSSVNLRSVFHTQQFGPKELFPCGTCELMYVSRNQVTLHRERHHARHLKCFRCTVSFDSSEEFFSHRCIRRISH